MSRHLYIQTLPISLLTRSSFFFCPLPLHLLDPSPSPTQRHLRTAPQSQFSRLLADHPTEVEKKRKNLESCRLTPSQGTIHTPIILIHLCSSRIHIRITKSTSQLRAVGTMTSPRHIHIHPTSCLKAKSTSTIINLRLSSCSRLTSMDTRMATMEKKYNRVRPQQYLRMAEMVRRETVCEKHAILAASARSR